MLIVDDSMAVCVRLSEMIASVPAIEVIQATDLAEGFDQLRQFTPDAMVLDHLEFPGTTVWICFGMPGRIFHPSLCW